MTDDTILPAVAETTSTELTRLPSDVATRAHSLAVQSRSEATLTTYRRRWQAFLRWCALFDLPALPAEPTTVAGWVADSGKSISTIRVTLSAICAPIGHRDRAMLLLGFAGAFRRSELAGLRLEHLDWRPEGLVVNLARSKTDQDGEGRKIGIPYGSDPMTCPVRVLRSWLAWMAQEARRKAPTTPSALFPAVTPSGALGAPLSGRARAAARAGVDPATVSGHSLRAGFATQAAMSGAAERAIARQTGHRNLQTLRKYIREGTLFRENAATKLGL